MTDDEKKAVELLRHAGFVDLPDDLDDAGVLALAQEIAALVTPSGALYTADQLRAAVQAERERCAKLCETLDHGAFGSQAYLSGIHDGSIGCANTIRKG